MSDEVGIGHEKKFPLEVAHTPQGLELSWDILRGGWSLLAFIANVTIITRMNKRMLQNAHAWKNPRYPDPGKRVYVKVGLQGLSTAWSSASLGYMSFCLFPDATSSPSCTYIFSVGRYWSPMAITVISDR